VCGYAGIDPVITVDAFYNSVVTLFTPPLGKTCPTTKGSAVIFIVRPLPYSTLCLGGLLGGLHLY